MEKQEKGRKKSENGASQKSLFYLSKNKIIEVLGLQKVSKNMKK